MTGPADPIAMALDNPVDAPVLAQPGDVGPQLGGDDYERPRLDPSCPVKPLGINSDISGTQKCYYLDYNGQLVGLDAGRGHGKNSMIALFGPKSQWMEAHYPQWSKPVTEYDRSTKTHTVITPSRIIGFDQAEMSRALIEECAARGIFDPAGRMRGGGAHRASDRGLVVHFGNKLLAATRRVDGRLRDYDWYDPGIYEGYVYTASRPLPRPHHEPVDTSAGDRLLALYKTWHWKRPALDPLLLLGQNMASFLGGALDWRTALWITGGAGTGKSTLNGKEQVLHQLHGDGAFRTANASAAAIRQSLRNATVPVFFDEIEATADNRRVNEVIELMRVAASGDDMHRGGSDHQAHGFTLQSCFWFSSINIPPLTTQDRSRLAILQLLPIPKGAPQPVLADYHLPKLGKMLLRRAIDGWERLRPTIERFRTALAFAGHTARAQDQFGTLLGCAHLALHDGLPDDETIALWCQHMAPSRIVEVSDSDPDHRRCLDHLLTSLQQARGGDERESIGTWIGRAAQSAATTFVAVENHDRSSERLQEIGLKLVSAVWHAEYKDATTGKTVPGRWGCKAWVPGDGPCWLAVAGNHRALDAVYVGQTWGGGVWRGSMARFSHAIDGVKAKFGKLSLTAVLVPMAAVLDDSELHAGSQELALAEWIIGQKGDGATW